MNIIMGEEDDDRMVIMDPDDAPILPLHDVVTNNHYGNIDYQNEYEERYLQQRADRTYAYGYQRPQINDPIVDPLEPGTQSENNCFLQTPQVHFDNSNPPPQRHSLTPARTLPPLRRTAPIPQRSVRNQPPPNLPARRPQPPPNPPMQQPRPQPLPTHRAIAANPMDQLIQSMNNLILAMGNNTNQP
ncbi:hypothetical protein F8M41_020193 [Gigaspora margarita]|uniref:Uncharacterized protein n=1 Tax=Gigaspora margarita TaxID=4874 RepID=A0A8H4AIX1_GIGMA|nr:hypothetical protein F8M41_020193 [Gigaspora margarita]